MSLSPVQKDHLRVQVPGRTKNLEQRFRSKYGAEYWDTWRISNWGTMRDTGRGGLNTFQRLDVNTSQVNIMTEGGPPVHVLDYWVDLGCDVRGSFFLTDRSGRIRYKNKRVWEWGEEIDRIKELKKLAKIAKRLKEPNLFWMIRQYVIMRPDCTSTAI